MGITVAMVTLSGSDQISSASFKETFVSDWSGFAIGEVRADEGVLSFELEGAIGFIAHMPAPVPWSDLEEACATSILWPDAEAVLRAHATHLIVTVTSEGSAVDRAKTLSMIIASVIKACPQVNGVYWGDAGLVVSAPMFRDFAVEMLPADPPLPMWVNLRVGQNENGSTSGFTRGLAGLGLMDLETETSTDTPAALRERFQSISMYLLEKGLVIRDGDTVGETAKEKIRVTYAPSVFGSSGNVMRLEFESVKKPFWKIW